MIILSSLPGHYPDDDDALPFFELVTSLEVPVFVHPPSVGFGEERLNIYRLASSVGRPMDGALAIARLIVRGVFEKFPQLKLVASHLGGGICEMIGRMDYAYNLQEEAYFLGPYEPMLIKPPAQPLPQDDVYRIDLLLGAGSAMRAGFRWGGPLHLRNRRAAAQAAEESRRRHHQVPQAQPRR